MSGLPRSLRITRYSKLYAAHIFLRSIVLLVAFTGMAAGDDLPSYLNDRGPGIPTSMFGTYVRAGEFLLYPFFEYYRDEDAEYKPSEMGFIGDHDFRGRYRADEGLIFLGYGVNDRLALEFEVAVIRASLRKSKDDPSDMPQEIVESGLGDVEGQIRWRWCEENAERPELFSFFETVFPLQKDRKLIGTGDWEFKLGAGAIRGFTWGTMTLRVAMEYSAEEKKLELGEYAVEYLKRLNPTWRLVMAVEGAQDEVSFITEAQVHLSRRVFIKLNNAFGLTSKAEDWAPEVGVMFSL